MTSHAPLRGLAVAAVAALLFTGCATDSKDGQPGVAPSAGQSNRPATGAPVGNPTAIGTGKAEEILQDNGYISYSEYKKDPSKYSKAVIFFTGRDCEPCKDIDRQLSTEKLPAGLVVVGTLLDDSKDVGSKYGVTKPGTFVSVDKTGKVLKTWDDSKTVADIAEKAK